MISMATLQVYVYCRRYPAGRAGLRACQPGRRWSVACLTGRLPEKGTLHIRTIWTGEVVFALWLCQQMSEMRGQFCQVYRQGKSLILATRDVVNC